MGSHNIVQGANAPATPGTSTQSRRIDPCRSVNSFDKIALRGEGTYGQVFVARDKETQKVRALKRVRMEKEKEGFPITALRELTILKRMKHPNIVDMVEVVVGHKQDSVFLVFEYCDHDLAALLDSSQSPPFSESEIKRLMVQLMSAVAFMHEHWVIHRDIKMSNLLYAHNEQGGLLKLCDFGLARDFGTPLRPYTPKVVTLWYRAPELLLGAKTYSSAIDIWACGAILGELLLHGPLLPGRTEQEQLSLTFDLLGAPNEAIWPGFKSLPNIGVYKLPHRPYNTLADKFQNLAPEGRDLLNSLLTYDPDKRPAARAVLDDTYFRLRPIPKPQELMPSFPTTSVGKPPAASARKRPRSQDAAAAGDAAARPRPDKKSDRFGLVF